MIRPTRPPCVASPSPLGNPVAQVSSANINSHTQAGRLRVWSRELLVRCHPWSHGCSPRQDHLPDPRVQNSWWSSARSAMGTPHSVGHGGVMSNDARPSRSCEDPFPIALFRRIRFRNGLFCPHCEGRHIQRWGHFGWRRRYRCVSCRRTFSDFTGTPLAYLKRVERWPLFCVRSLAAPSIRRTARELHLHSTTVFRWRHRLLRMVLRSERPVLEGRVAVGETWFPQSEKGSRNLSRPPRRRQYVGLSAGTDAVWVLLASDGEDRAWAAVLGRLRPSLRDLERSLSGRLDPAATLLSVAGPCGPAAVFARRSGRLWEQVVGDPWARKQPPEHPWMYRIRLKRWLRRFRGVATRYLSNYLAWFRLVDRCRRAYQGSMPLALLAGRFP